MGTFVLHISKCQGGALPISSSSESQTDIPSGLLGWLETVPSVLEEESCVVNIPRVQKEHYFPVVRWAINIPECSETSQNTNGTWHLVFWSVVEGTVEFCFWVRTEGTVSCMAPVWVKYSMWGSGDRVPAECECKRTVSTRSCVPVWTRCTMCTHSGWTPLRPSQPEPASQASFLSRCYLPLWTVDSGCVLLFSAHPDHQNFVEEPEGKDRHSEGLIAKSCINPSDVSM